MKTLALAALLLAHSSAAFAHDRDDCRIQVLEWCAKVGPYFGVMYEVVRQTCVDVYLDGDPPEKTAMCNPKTPPGRAMLFRMAAEALWKQHAFEGSCISNGDSTFVTTCWTSIDPNEWEPP